MATAGDDAEAFACPSEFQVRGSGLGLINRNYNGYK